MNSPEYQCTEVSEGTLLINMSWRRKAKQRESKVKIQENAVVEMEAQDINKD